MITVILSIVIVLLLIIIYHFYNFYIDPMEYPKVMYNNLVFATGDIILVREFNCVHSFLSGNKFSHVGIVIILGHVPYLLELSYPHVYLTLLSDRLSGADGSLFYIRKIINPIPETVLDDIPDILETSKSINYTNDLADYYISTKFSTIKSLNHTTETSEAVCGTFVIWMLTKLGVIRNLSVIPGSNSVTWLTDFHGTHYKPYRIKFFPGKPFMRIGDYGNMVLDKINSMSNPSKYRSTMLKSVMIT